MTVEMLVKLLDQDREVKRSKYAPPGHAYRPKWDAHYAGESGTHTSACPVNSGGAASSRICLITREQRLVYFPLPNWSRAGQQRTPTSHSICWQMYAECVRSLMQLFEEHITRPLG